MLRHMSAFNSLCQNAFVSGTCCLFVQELRTLRMTSKAIERKSNRKKKRCQHIITSETQIECNDQPKENLVVCNSGLSTGLKNDILLMEATKFGAVDQIILLPGKSYCFIKCKSIDDAIKIYEGMNARTRLGQNGAVLYLLYCKEVPAIENPWDQELPPGLILLQEFITELEEESLLDYVNHDFSIDNESILEGEMSRGSLKHRQVYHYGYEFKYDTNNVVVTKPLVKGIPDQCDKFWPRLKSILPQLTFSVPDQATVNEYRPGQGIPPHCDTHSAFLDPIFSLSLANGTVMEFRRPDNGRHVSVWLPRRSLLIMSHESRYGWTHGITPRKMDVIPTDNGLTVVERERRISFTFRSLKFDECHCKFPCFCDTYHKHQRESIEKIENLVLPIELELKNVHKVYDQIANHFSETRHSPWPKVKDFIESFVGGSVIMDIGCGNGKYLSFNDSITKIGCDRSQSLLNVCNQRGYNTFQCDCLYLPIKSNSVDGCISIAVIHHLVTKERRQQAIEEMARILVTGGRGLIYVWAKNQAKDTKSSYLRQNKKNNKNDDSVEDNSHKVEFVDGLPIHTNRTQFSHSDMLVPWKLKDDSSQPNKTFLRYYHVFEENELPEQCRKISNIRVANTYYDQGNWCLEFEKI